MWQYTNLNPAKKNVGDCVVRAICLATGKTWLSVYDDICLYSGNGCFNYEFGE